ncbi:hypothetical protein C2E21_6837 [Chlorella sorokiniana]|uniref:Uncharacterized protein n=1 Tax=Chlorella sorokiniana TaxID=3076 RepID=A0A2P6TJM8_CHLSO|nr:hypothetical protein C2E21_6837 [Chlorella sorokiniana]|eukprot:PRW44273.1 hypothetical protein C2E21_6837 [Chlorella sorokiniana]
MEGEGPAQKLAYALPEHLPGKKVQTEVKSGHEEGNKRWKEEEWAGAPPEHRDADSGVPGTSSPRGKVPETVEGREGWRD